MGRKRILLALLFLWFLAIVVIFFVAGNRSAAIFAFLYAIVYGGICYRYREDIRRLLAGIPGHRAVKFFGVAFAVATAEEIFCYLTGNRIALPVLWIDILFCCLAWTGWFGTWYFFLARRYRFGEREALLVAGLSGVLYEGAGPFLANPLSIFSILLVLPLLSLVYSALFLVPMQLIPFTGTRESPWKYPVSIVLPFLASIPIMLVLFVVFSVTGVALK
jgi:hypothetical protein